MHLDDELLADFAHGFFGYGNLTAPVWFIGMEEGGGNTAAEISARLDAWVSHDREPVADITSFGDAAGLEDHARWFAGKRPPLQSTWRQLILLQLARLGETCDAESARRYQRDRFARQDGNECLLELLPLPSPSVSAWHYSEWSALPWLESRAEYRRFMMGRRVEGLRELVETHRPSVVVFYGLGYIEHWRRIADRELKSDSSGLRRAATEATSFVAIPHPASRSWRNDDFTELGRLLR